MEKGLDETARELKKLRNDLQQVSEALIQSENLFQSLIKNIPGIVYLCNYDKSWTMHYIVKEIERISGYPASDFINNNVRSYVSIIHPDDVSLVKQAVKKGIKQNKPYELEYRIIRKDGEIVWVYEKGQKVKSKDNKIWLNGIIFDITKYKKNAIKLDIAAREWKATFDAIPNGMLLLNRECRIIKYNHAAQKMLDKKKTDIIGQRYYEAIYNLETPPDKDPHKKMLKSKHKEKILRKMGDRTVELTAVPIIDDKESIYGSVLLLTDFTELKEMESEIKNKNRQLESIFHTAPIGMGVVSHRIFIQVNEEMCRITGYSKDELVGHNARMFYSSDDEYKRVGAGYEGTKGKKIAVVRTKFRRKDGRMIDVLLHLSPLNTDIDGFTFTITNITKK